MLMIFGLFGAVFAGAAADAVLSLRSEPEQGDKDETPDEDDQSVDDQSEGNLLAFASAPSALDFASSDVAAVFDGLAERIHSSDAYPEASTPDPIIAFADDSEHTLNGGALNDLLAGGTVATLLAGHGGDDILISGTAPTHQIGGEGNDVLVGGVGDDRLEGGEGNDVLIAGLGNNTLMGGSGDDILVGVALDENGNDISGQNFLNGGTGNDVLIAGAGDYLNGGSGSDTFVLGQWLQSGDAVMLVDYDATEDQILLQYDPARIAQPDVDIRFNDNAPDTAEIWLGGHLIAQVANAPDLSSSDIGLVPLSSPGAGLH